MEKLYINFFVVGVIVLFGCTPPTGYSETDELYRDLVSVLKSDDDARLKEFCLMVGPDEKTEAFMKKIGFNVGGYPDDFDGELSTITDKYYGHFYAYRERLKARGFLSDLIFVEAQAKEVWYSETFGIKKSNGSIRLKSKDKILDVEMVKMYRLDGSWKMFTLPRFVLI